MRAPSTASWALVGMGFSLAPAIAAGLGTPPEVWIAAAPLAVLCFVAAGVQHWREGRINPHANHEIARALWGEAQEAIDFLRTRGRQAGGRWLPASERVGPWTRHYHGPADFQDETIRLFEDQRKSRLWRVIGSADAKDFPKKEHVEAALGWADTVEALYAAAVSLAVMARDTRQNPMSAYDRLDDFRSFANDLRNSIPLAGPVPEWLVDGVVVCRGYVSHALCDKAPEFLDRFETVCPGDRQKIAADPRAAADQLVAEVDRLQAVAEKQVERS